MMMCRHDSPNKTRGKKKSANAVRPLRWVCNFFSSGMESNWVAHSLGIVSPLEEPEMNMYIQRWFSGKSRKVKEHREQLTYLPMGANTWDVGHAAWQVEWHLRGWSFLEVESRIREGAETKRRGFRLSTFFVDKKLLETLKRIADIHGLSLLTHHGPHSTDVQVLGFWMGSFQDEQDPFSFSSKVLIIGFISHRIHLGSLQAGALTWWRCFPLHIQLLPSPKELSIGQKCVRSSDIESLWRLDGYITWRKAWQQRKRTS